MCVCVCVCANCNNQLADGFDAAHVEREKIRTRASRRHMHFVSARVLFWSLAQRQHKLGAAQLEPTCTHLEFNLSLALSCATNLRRRQTLFARVLSRALDDEKHTFRNFLPLVVAAQYRASQAYDGGFVDIMWMLALRYSSPNKDLLKSRRVFRSTLWEHCKFRTCFVCFSFLSNSLSL